MALLPVGEKAVRGFTGAGDERVGVREAGGDHHLAGFDGDRQRRRGGVC
ncbi:hypothetical protein [Streptomyces sp. enrichment culture]